jgi:ketosteroid isomerase-like protein
MSQENLKLARRAFDAFNRRDLDAMLALSHEDVLVESRLVVMEGGYHGREGVRRWWVHTFDVLPDYKIEVEEVRDLGEFTLARIHAHAHGAGSAAPLDETIWHAAQWRDGRYVWWRNVMTEDEALDAIGLRESDTGHEASP